ncbi:MAG: hypothetical protein ABW167_07815 [Baekduia sp.]
MSAKNTGEKYRAIAAQLEGLAVARERLAAAVARTDVAIGKLRHMLVSMDHMPLPDIADPRAPWRAR